MPWFKRLTVETTITGAIAFGSMIWRDDTTLPGEPPAHCTTGHPAPHPGCGCGYHLAGRAEVLRYPGAGVLPVARVDPLGRVGSAGRGLRCERQRIRALEFPDTCAWCLRRGKLGGLRPLQASPKRHLWLGVCTHCAPLMALEELAKCCGVPAGVLDSQDSEAIHGQLVSDLAIRPQAAWWILAALQSTTSHTSGQGAETPTPIGALGSRMRSSRRSSSGSPWPT